MRDEFYSHCTDVPSQASQSSGRKHGSLLWLEIKSGWAGTSCCRKLQSVLHAIDDNFIGRLKEAFHSDLVNTSADVSTGIDTLHVSIPVLHTSATIPVHIAKNCGEKC